MKDMLLEMGQVVLDSAARSGPASRFSKTASTKRPSCTPCGRQDFAEAEPQLIDRHRALLPAAAAGRHQRAGRRLDRQNVQRHRHGHEHHRLPRHAGIRGPRPASHPHDRRPQPGRGIARQRPRRRPGRLHNGATPRRDRRREDVPQRVHDGPHAVGQNPAGISRRSGAFRAA